MSGSLEQAEEIAPGQNRDGEHRYEKHFFKGLFFGHASLVQEFTQAGATNVAKAYLLKDGKETGYLAGDKDRPATVYIGPAQTIAFSPDVPWDFQDFASIPLLAEADIARLGNIAGVTVQQDGSTIRVTVERKPRDTLLGGSHWAIDFDMAHGAMVSKYVHVERSKLATDGKTAILSSSEQYVTRWTTKGGTFVPLDRTCNVSHTIDGHLDNSFSTTVQFSNYCFAPVKLQDLSVGRMGIPPGTVIIDRQTGIQWKYKGDARDVEIDGQRSPPTASGVATRSVPTVLHQKGDTAPLARYEDQESSSEMQQVGTRQEIWLWAFLPVALLSCAVGTWIVIQLRKGSKV